MSVDRANRSLAAMLALAGALSSVVALVGCCAFGALTYRVRTGGIVSLSTTGTQATLVLCVLVTGGMVLAIHGIRRQVRATQRLGRRVRRHILAAVPDALSVAAQHVGLDGRVDVIDAEEPCAFTWGLLRPRVAVSRALVEQMQSGELEAVLEHEHYHVVNFDAAKVFAARSVPMAFFYVPVLGFLRDRYLTARELAADRRAVEHHGPRPLAGALLKVVDGPAWANLDAAAAIGGDEALEARVAQLEEGVEPRPERPSAALLALSALGCGALVWSVVATLGAFGGPGALMRAVCTGS